MYLLDACWHDVNALRPLSSCRISQQLLTSQFAYRKLLEGGRIDRGMYLVRDNDDTFVWRKAACL